MKVLVLDNYDSFTWNLVDLLDVAARRLAVDLELAVVRNDTHDLNGFKQLRPAAVVLSPGPNAPDDAGICLELIRNWAGSLPILGICLGHQALAAAFGAAIVRAPAPVHGKRATISHDGQGLFANLPPDIEVMRYHSLCVDAQTLPPGFEVTAWLAGQPSEQNLVMGLRHRGLRLEGVQFHPESVGTPLGHLWAHNAVRWLCEA